MLSSGSSVGRCARDNQLTSGHQQPRIIQVVRIGDRTPLSWIAIHFGRDEAECFPSLDRPRLGAVRGMLRHFIELLLDSLVFAKSNRQLGAKWNPARAEKIKLFVDTL